MRSERTWTWRAWGGPWLPPLATTATVVVLAVHPNLLIPVARAYRDLCAQYPVLAQLTGHATPLPLALLLSLVAAAVVNGGAVGGRQFVGTLRFNRRLRRQVSPVPPRLAQVGDQLGLARLTYLDEPRPAAFCYGFLRPRVAVTAGLLARLDDEELVAVLAHEGHHLRRRDPVRYLALHMLTAAAFMVPIAPAVRERLATHLELAADRAALAVAPRGALAGALLAVLTSPSLPTVGAAELSATEARIAHLAGRPAWPAIPLRAVLASLVLMGIIAGAVASLTTSSSAHLVPMVCPLCTGSA